jgi:hypothetical protein
MIKKTAHHQAGHAYTEIFLGLLFVVLLCSNAIRGYHLLQQNKAVQLHYQITQILAAWYDFKDKYHSLPGDYAFALSDIDSALRNGNGNGLIDSDQERGQVWAHLSAVALLKKRFDGGDQNASQACPRSRCPDNGVGQGFIISHYLPMGNVLFTGKGIALTTLALLDQQIDDGLPHSGKVQLLPNAPPACLQADRYAHNDTTHCQLILPIP